MLEGDFHNKLSDIIGEMRLNPDVIGVVVARRDGVVLGHNMPKGTDPRKLAAMSAAIVSTSELAAAEIGQIPFMQSIVESANGRVIARGAGPDAIIVVLIAAAANLGLLLLSLDKTTNKLEDLFGEVDTYSLAVQ